MDTPTVPPPRVAVWLYYGVQVLAMAGLLAALVWLIAVPPFPGRLAGVLVFVAAWLERMWSMYVRLGRGRASAAAGRDWSALAVGYSFALVVSGGIVEFLLRRHGLGADGHTLAGVAVYAASLALRYWAFAELGRQFHIDVSDPGRDRRLIRTGPYRFLRHPIYAASCLEAVGLPLLLGAWYALALAVCVFIPLEVARARYEERFLREVFGPDYDRFKAEVPGFLPRWRI